MHRQLSLHIFIHACIISKKCYSKKSGLHHKFVSCKISGKNASNIMEIQNFLAYGIFYPRPSGSLARTGSVSLVLCEVSDFLDKIFLYVVCLAAIGCTVLI